MELPTVTRQSLGSSSMSTFLSASTSTTATTSTSSRASALGLTALHIAVINNDRDKVRALLSGKEHAPDERTSTGGTALMLASLYGRFDIFVYLLKKTASVFKQDHEGFGCNDYVKHLAFTNPLLQQYKTIALESPRLSGRKAIYKLLRPFASIMQRLYGSNKVENLSPTREQSEHRTVSLRKGGVFEIVEVRRLALAEWHINLARKTCAAIRGNGEATYRAIAISGWRGDKAKKVENVVECLNNAEYLRLTRDFANTIGYKIPNNWLDYRFPGSPSEKAGAFSACHAEKQLAVYALRESMAQMLGSRDITSENLTKLKLAIERGFKGLQPNFTIDLEHKPCPSCVTFLELMPQKTGLHFEWVQREWFSEGQRSRMRMRDSLRASPDDLHTFEDEVDEGDSDWELVPELDATIPARPADDTDEDWVMV